MAMQNNFKIMNARVTVQNVPIHKLERYQFSDIDLVSKEFKKIANVSECVIVQTASRVEVFLIDNTDVQDIPDARRDEGAELTVNEIRKVWAQNANLQEWDLDHFDQTMEVYVEQKVYENLLKLAVGLQSVVIGKKEILEQIKGSIANAKQAKHSGVILNKLFDTIILVATKIRKDTGIDESSKSIGDIAIKLAQENAGIDDPKKKVLLIGTGETAARVAKSLNRKKIAFSVTSMQLERAQGFTKTLKGEAVEFKDVIENFAKFDIIFVATTADYFILEYDRIKRQMESKKTGTMILDISEPRAISEDVSMCSGLKLMFRDQVEEQYTEVIKMAHAKIPAVEKAIAKEVPTLDATMNKMHAEPINRPKDVFAKVDQLREQELKKALKKLGDIDQEKIKVIEQLTKSVIENIVTIPQKSDDKDNSSNDNNNNSNKDSKNEQKKKEESDTSDKTTATATAQ